ncbi:MAG TPA: hypothetical protein VFO27_11420 [Bryobacteraceae bacterium]|nr:hypothetical protein [Bryobacteraceae bacterium]
MAFIITGACILVLFLFGLYFTNQERKEAADKEAHSAMQKWNGVERRKRERRKTERHQDAVLTR